MEAVTRAGTAGLQRVKPALDFCFGAVDLLLQPAVDPPLLRSAAEVHGGGRGDDNLGSGVPVLERRKRDVLLGEATLRVSRVRGVSGYGMLASVVPTHGLLET